MQELVAINPVTIGSEEVSAVNARELHAKLEVKTRFNDWIIRRIDDCSADEGIDFTVLKNEYGEFPGFQSIDYFLSLDLAKEFSMLEKTEIGKATRRYFIQCEKELRSSFTLVVDQEVSVIQLRYICHSSLNCSVAAGLTRRDAYVKMCQDQEAIFGIERWKNLSKYVGILPPLQPTDPTYTLGDIFMNRNGIYALRLATNELVRRGLVSNGKVTENGSWHCLNPNVELRRVRWSAVVKDWIRLAFAEEGKQQYLKHGGILIM